MSIALPTLVLFYLVLPGIVFRRFYYTEEFSKQYFKSSFGDLVLATVLPSIFIHALLIGGWHLAGHSLDSKTLSNLLAGGDNDSVKALLAVLDSKFLVFLYALIACVIAGGSGALTKFFIRRNKLDRKYKIFRFQNEWHYLFSGEILDFPRVSGKVEEVSFRYVDALVETGDGPVIYMGILSDYVLSKDGGIDRICLSKVRRRKLSDDPSSEAKIDSQNIQKNYYTLPGDFFVLPFSQVKNLHITYYEVKVRNANQDF